MVGVTCCTAERVHGVRAVRGVGVGVVQAGGCRGPVRGGLGRGGLRDVDVHRERDRLRGRRRLGAVLGRLEVAREVVEPQRDEQPDVIGLQAEMQRVLTLLETSTRY